MSHTPHELAEDFPGQADRIRALRETDGHFARLLDSYHAVNRQVHRAETLVEPVAPEHETRLRRERMQLKDNIARLLRGEPAA